MRLFLIFLIVRIHLCTSNEAVTESTPDLAQSSSTTLAPTSTSSTEFPELVSNGTTAQLETTLSQNQSFQSTSSENATTSSETIPTENLITGNTSESGTTVSQKSDWLNQQKSTTKKMTTVTITTVNVSSSGELPVGENECTLITVSSLSQLHNCGIINGDLVLSGQHVETKYDVTTSIAEIRGCLQIYNTKLNATIFITEKTTMRKRCVNQNDRGAVSVIKNNGHDKFQNGQFRIPKNVYISMRRQVGGSITIQAVDENDKFYDPNVDYYGILCTADEALSKNSTKECEEIDGDLVVNGGKPTFERFQEVVTVHGRIIINNTEITEFRGFQKLKNVYVNGKGPALLISNNKKLANLHIHKFDTNSSHRAIVVVNNGDYRMPLDDYKLLLDTFENKSKLMIPVVGNRTAIYKREYKDTAWTYVLIYGVAPALPPAILGLGLLMKLAFCSNDGSTT